MGKCKQRCKVKWLAAWLLALLWMGTKAQLPTMATTVTKNDLVIGEQATLTIKATCPNGYSANWFALPDSLPYFEVVEAGKIDTVLDNGTVQLRQSLVFTSFDSGRWVTPPLAVAFQPVNGGQPLTLYADTLPLRVGFMADTTDAIRDVKPIIEAEGAGFPWGLLIAIGAAVLVVLIVLVWLLYRLLTKKAPMVAIGGPSVYQQVMQRLAALEQLDITVPSSCKQYHTQLALLYKTYMGHRLGLPLTNATTSDTLQHLKSTGMAAETLAGVADALRGCDAVKFARFMPGGAQCRQWMEQIKASIEQTEKQTVAT
jgi:hypothetical protein